MLKKSTSILIQTVVWLSVFTILFIISIEFNTWYEAILKAFLMASLLSALAYTNAFILIPTFFNSKRIVLYIVIVLGLILGSVYLATNFIFVGWDQLEIIVNNQLTGTQRITNGIIIFQPLTIILTLSSFFISSIVVILKEITTQKAKYLQSEIEKKTTELKLMTTQFGPHFLLNSLNNLYSISKLKPEKVSEHVQRLSALMTHITYQQHEDEITLEKAIDFIENYIYFQKEKGDNLYAIHQNFEQVDPSLRIDSKLLIPFVENAFKYAYHPDKTMKVDLTIENDETELRFKISNEISDYERRKKEDGYYGVGIDSIKLLLEHSYPNKYTLTITEKDNYYTVDLKLTIAE